MQRRRAQQARKETVTFDCVIRVWYVEPFGTITERVAFMWFDGLDYQVLCFPGGTPEQIRSIIDESLGLSLDSPAVTIIETHGVDGIAETDPHWDGTKTFRCGNCSIDHSTDETVAMNLYRRMCRSAEIEKLHQIYNAE